MRIEWKEYGVVKRAIKNGCKAETPSGVARWLRKRVSPTTIITGLRAVDLGWKMPITRSVKDKLISMRRRDRWVSYPLHDHWLATHAKETMEAQYPKRRNWREAMPLTDPTPGSLENGFGCVAVSCGRYSSRCNFTRFEYIPTYHSEIRLYRSMKTVEVWQERKMVRRIKAPYRLRFGSDSLGVFVVSKDGTEYHPDSREWTISPFESVVRMALSRKRRTARVNAILLREQKHLSKIRDRQLPSCRVTLDDSRRAGNCVEGSLRFAESRLGMTREDIIAGSHLVHVSGARLLSTGDDRARRAVEAAWQRETLVSI